MAGRTLPKLTTKASHSRPWFYFDEDYYVHQCLLVGAAPPVDSGASLLQHYLRSGARNGLSPNPLFDEQYYRMRYPDVAREVQIGTWACAFDHYVEIGAIDDASPAWFFDGIFYRNIHADLTDKNLQFGGFQDRFAHYLLVGIKENRASHWAIQALQVIKGSSTFPTDQAGLAALVKDGAELPDIFRPVFDFGWMKEKYDWGNSVKPGGFMKHYLLNARAKLLSPSPYFDEAFYLSREPEIRLAVEGGTFSCGYEHFVLHGMNEWRAPFEAFDPHYYFATNMAAESRAAPSLSPFTHFLRNRGRKRLPISKPLSELEIPEIVGKALYERRCAFNAGQLESVRFVEAGERPAVSIIVIARDNFEQTANCLVSAHFNTEARLEVIVFDNGSTDDTSRLPVLNPTIKYLRSEENQGFTTAVNRAAEVATGDIILLLNNDIELTPHAIDLAVERLRNEPTVGAVGAKIVRMHGRLQEGGSIIWRDGTCLGYGRDSDPADGQVGFVRDVDFCSGCFLAIRKADWQALGGFDEAYAPAYYEETDFCVRIWERGLRVVYDPRIVIWHFEFGSSAIREEPLALMRRNQRYFVKKHRAFLSKCLPPAPANIERARLRHVAGPRALFIEDKLPDPAKGMGFVRSAKIADALVESCGVVSLLGLHDTAWPGRLPEDGSGRRLEVLTRINVTNVDSIFRDRVGAYDLVWLSRTHNLRHLKAWRDAYPAFFANVRVVLDTEAIAATRRNAYAQLTNQTVDLAGLVAEELDLVEGVDEICVVNELDRALVRAFLESRGLDIPVSILGHSLIVQPHPPSFEATTDIVLTGSYSELDGPNADGLLWFDRVVRPLIPELPGLRYVIAGSKAGDFVRASPLKHDYTVVSDPPDMAGVLRSARLMVAPTRFAAGVPMKVHEAASHGVPVVVTSLLAEQLGWQHEVPNAPAGNPEKLANAIGHLASHGAAWERIQSRLGKLVARDCSPERFEQAVRRITRSQQELKSSRSIVAAE